MGTGWSRRQRLSRSTRASKALQEHLGGRCRNVEVNVVVGCVIEIAIAATEDSFPPAKNSAPLGRISKPGARTKADFTRCNPWIHAGHERNSGAPECSDCVAFPFERDVVAEMCMLAIAREH